MIDIAKKQYKLLCKIKKKTFLELNSLSDEEKEMCEYLLDENCIKPYISMVQDINGYGHSIKSLPNKIELTQSGYAQIYAFKSKFYKTRISLILSIFSTVAAISSSVVAIIALLKP